ncbi:MAG: hypothetical protein WCB46_07290, partial [Methanoregula sp.]
LGVCSFLIISLHDPQRRSSPPAGQWRYLHHVLLEYGAEPTVISIVKKNRMEEQAGSVNDLVISAAIERKAGFVMRWREKKVIIPS